MGLLAIILFLFVLWWLTKGGDIDAAARLMLSEFEKAENNNSNPSPLKSANKILDGAVHKKYGKLISASGYKFLGYIDADGSDNKWRQVTSAESGPLDPPFRFDWIHPSGGIGSRVPLALDPLEGFFPERWIQWRGIP